MTLEQWTAQVMNELADAGFEVSVHQGFPLVKRPEKFADGVRLIKFKTSLPADRRIYDIGMLFLPAGAWQAADRLLRAENEKTSPAAGDVSK